MDINVCRVCLSSNANKDIKYKSNSERSGNKSFIEILLFCLGIQIVENTKFGYKLCLQCYDKVLEYHEFKTLALESDAYFKSLDVKLLEDKTIIQKGNIKREDSSDFIDDCFENIEEINLEDIKQECLEYSPDGKAIFVFDNNTKKTKTKKKDRFKNNEKTNLEDINQEYLEYLPDVETNVVFDSNVNAKTKEKASSPRKNKTIGKVLKEKVSKSQICEKCGESVRDLKEHLKLHKSDRKQYNCKYCEKTFKSSAIRNKHVKFIHLGFKYTCDICEKKVRSLSSHKRVVHNSESLSHVCSQCGRRFISQSQLNAHLVTHVDPVYECQTCGSKYRTKINLQSHIRRVHEQEKTHLCQFCSKGFFRKYNLQLHLRYHTKEKPYKCDECDKNFSTSENLKSHKLIHANVRKYECEHCSMTFVKIQYLRNHMISHTKEKRYTCKYCGAKFGRSDHCKRHEFTAHEKFLSAFQTTPKTY